MQQKKKKKGEVNQNRQEEGPTLCFLDDIQKDKTCDLS